MRTIGWMDVCRLKKGNEGCNICSQEPVLFNVIRKQDERQALYSVNSIHENCTEHLMLDCVLYAELRNYWG